MNKEYYFTVGTDSFQDLVSSDQLNIDPHKLFVDKSLFIKDFIDNNSKVLLITRPRRWGKSLILSMLQHFFSKEVNRITTKNLFKNLKISEYLKNNSKYANYQGQYPVIFVSFKDLEGIDYPTTENRTKEIISELYRQHIYLLQSTDLEQIYKSQFENILNKAVDYGELVSSLKFLSEILYKHHGKKVYILIDEYDSMLNNLYADQELLKKITIFFNNLFGSCLKGNYYLEKGLVTGVLRVVTGNIFYGLNNLSEYTVLDNQFSEYYGFTGNEVNELFKKTGINKDDKISNWYNGYVIGNNAIYNPWSIMQCLNNHGELTPYWIKSSNPSMLKDLLINTSSTQHKLRILELIKTGTAKLKATIKSQVSLEQINIDLEYLWSVLVHAGYLTITKPKEQTTVKLPNKEIAQLITEYINQWFESNPLLCIAANNLLDGNFLEFKDVYKEVLIYQEAISYLLSTSIYSSPIFYTTNINSNRFLFKDFLYQFIIMVELRCIIAKETAVHEVIIESNNNYTLKKDLIFQIINHKKKSYMIVNVKENKNVDADLASFAKELCSQQIENQNVDVKLKDYKIIKIGIAFCGTEFEIDLLA